MIREPELWLRFRSLANAATQRLFRELTEGERPRGIVRQRVVRDAPERPPGVVHVVEPLWPSFVGPRKELIAQLPEYGALMSDAIDNKAVRAFLGRKVPIRGSPSPDVLRHLIHVTILRGYLDQAVALALGVGQALVPEEELCELYEDLEGELYDDPARYLALAPVAGLSVDAAPVHLSESHRIRALTDADRDCWLESSEFLGVGGGLRAVLSTQFAVEVEKEIAKGDQVNFQQEIEQVLVALRLLKPGGVSVPTLIRGRVRDWKRRSATSVPLLLMSWMDIQGGLHLSAEECAQFAEFWRWYSPRARNLSTSLQIALRRFSRASGEAAREDRLIDCCVGFDALLNAGPTQELSYRLAQRAAFLVGRDRAERDRIYGLLDVTNKIRGDVIHGSKTFEHACKGQSPGQLIDQLLDLLRRLILIWLSLPEQMVEDGHTWRLSGKEIGPALDANTRSVGELLRPHFSEWVYRVQ